MSIEFNNYNIDEKIEDLMRFLNEDFAKVKNLEVGGGVPTEPGEGGPPMIFAMSLPPATVELRGILIYVFGRSDNPDNVYVCKKLANNEYKWYQIA